ncbi:MAG TPA: cobalamin-independent methionine synthase II family protein [Rhizomicrobium sp.]|nr:cobalamin-independent methionine synthase II family protein [Rhizomicrobium sp.]
MRHSKDHILTTHVGSLPRSQELVDVLLRKDRGEAYDVAEYDRVIAKAVHDAVKAQAAIGIDVPSDGEQSKVSYSTYMMDRLTGFGGDNERRVALDLKDYPEFRQKMGRMTGSQEFRRSSCIGPVTIKDLGPLHKDLENLRAAAKAAGVAEAFMNSASPGLITAFQPNKYYPKHEAYIEALADVMREEYHAIVSAGLLLQLDCPDLAMAAHIAFQDLSEADFLKRAALHVEALNHALEGIDPARVRMHICWGNYEGPHDHDIAVEKILPIVAKAKPQAILFEGANVRHEHEWLAWRDARLPDDKILVPGMIDTCSNYVEHPELVAQRIERWADAVGRERIIAGTDCGFGTFAGYGKLDGRIAYKKLEALAEGAALATKRLWSKAA